MFPANERFFGERLQLAREFRGLTQKQLGEMVVASHELISQYENGKKQDPPLSLIEALGSVLGFSNEFFFRPVEDLYREEQCSFRHRRTTPEKLKTQIRAHGTLLGMVICGVRTRLRLPQENIPSIRAST